MKLSKATVELIMSGVALDKLDLSAPEANVDGVKPEADALAALQAEATLLIDVVAAQASKAGEVQAQAVTAATAPLTAQIATLTEAVTAAQAKVTLAEEAAASLTGKLTASAELAGKQAEIVKTSLSTMSVALGGTADLGASLTGTELLAEHDRLATQFQAKFPAGGVAAVAAVVKKDQKHAGPSAQFRSLLKPAA